MTMNPGPDRDLLVVDLMSSRSALLSGSLVEGLTERHRVDLLAGAVMKPDSNVASTIAAFAGRAVAFVVNQGLPDERALRAASGQLNKTRLAFFYWPNEQAIEVADRLRIASYWRHVWFYRFLRFPNILRSRSDQVKSKVSATPIGRAAKRTAINWTPPILSRRRPQSESIPQQIDANTQRRIASRDKNYIQIGRRLDAIEQTRAAATTLFGSAPWSEDMLPSPSRPLPGRGLYVRLDYWVKLETGGSYGHTCFLAKSAAAATEKFECIFANRFELLDTMGVKQHVLEYQFQTSQSMNFIEVGEKYVAILRNQFAESKPSYVYERTVLGNCAVAQLCEEMGIPYIAEFNGSELSMARSFGQPYELESTLERIEDYSFSVAALINVISEPVAESLVERGVPRAKILVNPNAVDPDFYKPVSDEDRSKLKAEFGVPQDAIVVGFCGTFGGWHGIEVLAEGMARICKQEPRAHFLLIGDGNLKPLVRKVIEENKLASQVTDLGLIAQAVGARAMSVCDILGATHAQNIGNRTFFGSPTKLFEYMAIGAAIVSSDLAQLGEVMRPALINSDFREGNPKITNQRGVLVKPGDVDDFVLAVQALISHSQVRRELGANARQAAINNYTWDNHFANIWRQLAGLPLKGYVSDKQNLV